MGSSRLPGKMTLPIFGGKGALALMLERVARASLIDELIVATTELPEDDVLAELCRRSEVPCFRGSPTDVLDRYYRCARSFNAGNVIVRLTGDCPLHDPNVIDDVIRLFLRGAFDYAANTHPPTFPDGLDVEVFSLESLEIAWRRATLVSEREHVTYYIYTHPTEFRLANLAHGRDLSGLRWTLDEPRDLEFVRAVYSELGGASLHFGMNEVLALVEKRPELGALNQDIRRNEGLEASLEIDRRQGSLL
jgi:spore coat polysaccharide biosynthesis protein SpsF